MTLSMGIEHTPQWWRICLIEDGEAVETAAFADVAATLAYVKHTCGVYPELALALAADLCVEFTPLQALLNADPAVWGTEEQAVSLVAFVRELGAINLHSYSLPPVLYTPAVPMYRRLVHRSPGSPRTVGALAALLYRLRARAAEWFEMNFLYLELEPTAYHLAIVRSGLLIDGVEWRATQNVPAACNRELPVDEQLVEQAYWEALSRDLTSMMELHHLEDMVIAEHGTMGKREEATIERLGDSYQCYLFPRSEGEARAFTAAYGAALLAEGLYRPGPSAEIAERLLPDRKTERGDKQQQTPLLT